MKPITKIFAVLSALLLVFACKPEVKPDPVKVHVTGVKVTPSSAEIQIDGTVQLKARITPNDADIKTVTWESEDEDIATVDEKGLVTGVAEGEVEVIAVSDDGGYVGSCTVTVKPAPAPEPPADAPAPYGACPTEAQVTWLRMETNMFIHFGPNTFTSNEWGSGGESESVFNPKNSQGQKVAADVEQWVSVAKRNGFQGIVLTAKHHDGFYLWPYSGSTHTIAQSPYRDGKGDLVQELYDECVKQGVKFGLYVSPADLNDPSFGTGAAYNTQFANAIRELHSKYELFEQWFDGAQGGSTKTQNYDFNQFNQAVLENNPGCTIFSNVGPGCRWVGNEYGFAKETNWATFTPSRHNCSQASLPGDYGTYLGSGDEGGQYWIPAESDVSIRTKNQQDNGDPMWFWNNLGNERTRSAKNLMKLYYQSVGRNSILLLNVPPNSAAKFDDADVASLDGFKSMKDQIFAKNLAEGATVVASNVRGDAFAAENMIDGNYDSYFATEDGVKTVDLEFTLAEAATFNRVVLQEYIPLGQRVKGFTVYYKESATGSWKSLKSATTIGHKRILLTNSVKAVAVKVSITSSLACPVINTFGLYNDTVSGLSDSNLDK